MFDLHTRGLAAGLLCLMPAAYAAAQDEVPAPVDVPEVVLDIDEPVLRHGERLGPELLGEGIIESMEQVLERDRQLRLQGPPKERRLRNGRQGVWVVPGPRGLSKTKSGAVHIVNKWGDTRMGVSFPEPVRFEGAWFAGQAAEGAWADGIRIIGFKDGTEVARTDWSERLERDPRWHGAGFDDVDRIEIQAVPVQGGAGWYAMDDFTFTYRSTGVRVVLDFENAHLDTKLTGSGFAGLTWETGTGDFDAAKEVHAPMPVEDENDLAGEDDAPPPAPQGGSATVPTLIDDFQGVIRGDAGQASFPPDTCGAVGPNHFVEAVNRNFSVYLKSTGARVMNVSLGAFQPGTSGDPRVLYDTHSDRWVVMSTDFNTRIYLAVSTSSNPLGTWFKTSYVASAGSDAGCWPDFPTLGLNEDGIFVAANMFNGCARTLWAIDKAPLIDSNPSLGAVTAFRNLSDATIQPCETFGSADQYTISTVSGVSSQLRVRRVNPPITSPSLSIVGTTSISSHSSPSDAPAQGSTTNIDTGDRRLSNAVYRNGTIWCANTISFGGRSAVRWYRVVAANGVLSMTGTIDDPSLWYYYGGIAVNENDDMVIGFSGSNSGQFVGCYYTGRRSDDPAGQTAPVQLLRSGNASYTLVDGIGRNRWGDYSMSTIDPNDGLTFWTVQEYAHSTNNWGTQIASFAYSFPPENDMCVNAINVPPGQTAFGNHDATLDGPLEPDCSHLGAGADVWFRTQASEDGNMIISVCDATYDTLLAVYDFIATGCPTSGGDMIACNDDGCNTQSIVNVPVNAGQVLLIRVSGKNSAMGDGTLDITLVPDQSCVGDLDDSGAVNTSDMLVLLANWGNDGAGAELAEPTNVVDTADLLVLLAAWGPCP